MAAYEAAKGIEYKTSDRSRAALPGTWRWLCVRYFSECAEYKRLDARTQRVRRQILEGTFDEPIAPKSERFFRDFPIAKMNANAVEVLRDRKYRPRKPQTDALKQCGRCSGGASQRDMRRSIRRAKLNTSNPAQKASIRGHRRRCSNSRNVIR